jgi:small-conductance mechanosensitive channel/CRP-like cAMP-binding protein
MHSPFSALWTQYVWTPETPALLTLAVVLSAALLRYCPPDRRSVLNTFTLLLLSLAGRALAGVAAWADFTRGAEIASEIFIILGGFALIRLAGLFLLRLLLPLIRIRPPQITQDLLMSAAYLGWMFVRLRYAGLDLSSLLATSAVITAVLAFAMQDTLGNILGGITLQLDNSIQLGDWIKVDDLSGRVVSIRWRFTAIETRNWETVVIPNSVLMKGKFMVLGRREGEPVQWRRWVWFNVPADVPPGKVLRIAEKAVRSLDSRAIAREPAPNAVLMEFDSGYLRYAVRYWLTDLAVDDPTDSLVRTHLHAALARAGMPLAQSEYRVNMVEHDAEYLSRRADAEIKRRITLLRNVDLLRTLTDPEMRTVAERLVPAPYVQGGVITRQGAVAHWLYILVSGEADVYLEMEGQPRQHVATLDENSFFGEMALLTGEPRRATVVARTDVDCYRLDKESFEGILKARPELAEEISGILAGRLASLRQAQDDQFEASQRQHRDDETRLELLSRIQHFFNL